MLHMYSYLVPYDDWFLVTWSAPPSTQWASPAPPPQQGRALFWQNDASLMISSGEISQVCMAANLAKCPPEFWSSWQFYDFSGIIILKIFLLSSFLRSRIKWEYFCAFVYTIFWKILHRYSIIIAFYIVYTFSGTMFIVFVHIVD